MSSAAVRHEAPGEVFRPGDVDLSDPRTFLAGVPNEYFRVLREQDPVHWQEERPLTGFLPSPGYWALTRYEDVALVSKHPELFSTELGSSSLNDLPPSRFRRHPWTQPSRDVLTVGAAAFRVGRHLGPGHVLGEVDVRDVRRTELCR